jgi:hypothetical protein
MNDQSPPPTTTKGEALARVQVLQRVQSIGQARDGLLVLAGTLYVSGYVVWSINAWKNNLGMLPALDSQYFVAGVIPTMILTLVGVGIKLSWNYSRPTPWWFNNDLPLTGWKRIVRAAVALYMGLVIFLPGILAYFGWIEKHFPARAKLIMGVMFANQAALYIFWFVGVLIFDTTKPAEAQNWLARLRRLSKSVIKITVITAIGLIALTYYLQLLYSRLPQAFGGVRPRCAYLDVVRDSVSEETVSSLIDDSRNTPAAAITQPASAAATPLGDVARRDPPKVEAVRTRAVEVLFSGSDYTIVRTNGNIYEIKKDVIRAIDYCH